MLLTTVHRPRSFEDLRTIDEILHDTFCQVCITQELLDDDKEWIRCFTDAALFSSGRALRNLFVIALLHGGITNPPTLWV